MDSKFEIFIKEKVLSPSEPSSIHSNSWDSVDKKLRRNVRRKLIVRMSIAASLLLMIGLGSGLLMNNQNQTTDYYSDTIQELNETSNYYGNQIEAKYTLLADFENLDKEYFKVFFDELEELDKDYEAYLNDAKAFGFQEDIARALVNNLQRKLQIINNLLIEIKKVNDYENRKISI